MYDLFKPELDNRDVVDVAYSIQHENWDPLLLINGEKSEKVTSYLCQLKPATTVHNYSFSVSCPALMIPHV